MILSIVALLESGGASPDGLLRIMKKCAEGKSCKADDAGPETGKVIGLKNIYFVSHGEKRSQILKGKPGI
jgi:hypothetical protein